MVGAGPQERAEPEWDQVLRHDTVFLPSLSAKALGKTDDPWCIITFIDQ